MLTSLMPTVRSLRKAALEPLARERDFRLTQAAITLTPEQSHVSTSRFEDRRQLRDVLGRLVRILQPRADKDGDAGQKRRSDGHPWQPGVQEDGTGKQLLAYQQHACPERGAARIAGGNDAAWIKAVGVRSQLDKVREHVRLALDITQIVMVGATAPTWRRNRSRVQHGCARC